MGCDVLLLTEASEEVEPPRVRIHASPMRIAPSRDWAAVATRRPLVALADPHWRIGDGRDRRTRFSSSVLPWRFYGTASPWMGSPLRRRPRRQPRRSWLAIQLCGARIGTTPRLAVSGAAHSTGGDRHSRPSTGSGWPTTCVCPVANEPPRSSGDTELRATSPSMCGTLPSQRCPDAPNALWPMSTQPPLPLPQHRPSPAPAAPCVDAPDAGRPVSDRQALDPGIAPDRLDELHASGHPTDLHDDAKDAVIRGRGWANIPEDRGLEGES